MMANREFEREAAYRNRLAILIALVAHLILLGAIVFHSDIQGLIGKDNQPKSAAESVLQP